MKRCSNKRRRCESAARPAKDAMITEAGKCMICGHSPASPWRDKPMLLSLLCCHEIACGSHRQKAIGKPFATLVLCWWCNGHVVTDKKLWPEARQLSVLKRKSAAAYDLAKYNALVNSAAPNRITPEDVEHEGQKC